MRKLIALSLSFAFGLTLATSGYSEPVKPEKEKMEISSVVLVSPAVTMDVILISAPAGEIIFDKVIYQSSHGQTWTYMANSNIFEYARVKDQSRVCQRRNQSCLRNDNFQNCSVSYGALKLKRTHSLLYKERIGFA